VDETYVKVTGQWKYLYRAVDKEGATHDFLLKAKRDADAVKRFFKKSIPSSGMPEKVTIDKSGSNKAAAESFNIERRRCKKKKKKILIQQIKYLNNIVVQDHRAIKRRIRPMPGFKSFRSATKTIAGIEIMHMMRKGQMAESRNLTHSEQFLFSGWLIEEKDKGSTQSKSNKLIDTTVPSGNEGWSLLDGATTGWLGHFASP
jgi:transposase-like protein